MVEKETIRITNPSEQYSTVKSWESQGWELESAYDCIKEAAPRYPGYHHVELTFTRDSEKYAASLFNRGMAHKEKGNYSAALEDVEKARNLEPVKYREALQKLCKEHQEWLATEEGQRWQAEEEKRKQVEEAARTKAEAEKKKKRLKTLLVTGIAVVMLIAFIIYRQTGSFFDFHQDDQGTVYITGYSGKKQVVIPTTNRGINVTRIAGNAFYGKKLTSVTIPDGITYIGKEAFRDNLLTSMIVPDSVTSIGDRAFISNNLTSVTIPDSVISIGGGAFAYNQLSSVTIPDSVTSIGDGVFRNNNLTSVTIPDSVTTIGKQAFCNNRLTSVTIGNSVTSIGDETFSSNQLTSVTIGNSVTSIGDKTFFSNQLTSVIIPNSVKSIGVNAFDGNAITSVSIGANVKLGESKDNAGVLGQNTGFNTAYEKNGKRAGTYTRPNFNSTTWTRK